MTWEVHTKMFWVIYCQMILFANVFNLLGTSPRADRTKLPIKVEEVEKKKKE